MSEASAALIGLTVITVVCKGAGAMLRHVPDGVARRLGGLAPALLAALVASEIVGDNGLPKVDAKLAGVAVALVLTARRTPLAVCVVAGAGVAAAIRAGTGLA